MAEAKKTTAKKTAPKKAVAKKNALETLQAIVEVLRAEGWTVDGRVSRLNDGVSEGVNL